ncbi:MAG: hypothetical protein GY943_14945, partial [Chloroflexi bacterium]|nr:hypothetical protein [Chloroflexota bacterium]
MFTKIKRFPLMILTSSFVILMATIWSQKSLAESATAVDSCIPPPADIISWWPGDGNANDIRGGYDGTLINGASFASGKVGQAFSFDGVDDGVIVPNPSMLNFGVGADFSLTAWIRITPNAPNPPSNQFTILSKRYAPSIDADPT